MVCSSSTWEFSKCWDYIARFEKNGVTLGYIWLCWCTGTKKPASLLLIPSTTVNKLCPNVLQQKRPPSTRKGGPGPAIIFLSFFLCIFLKSSSSSSDTFFKICKILCAYLHCVCEMIRTLYEIVHALPLASSNIYIHTYML